MRNTCPEVISHSAAYATNAYINEDVRRLNENTMGLCMRSKSRKLDKCISMRNACSAIICHTRSLQARNQAHA